MLDNKRADRRETSYNNTKGVSEADGVVVVAVEEEVGASVEAGLSTQWMTVGRLGVLLDQARKEASFGELTALAALLLLVLRVCVRGEVGLERG